jgi:hypothetical protein
VPLAQHLEDSMEDKDGTKRVEVWFQFTAQRKCCFTYDADVSYRLLGSE